MNQAAPVSPATEPDHDLVRLMADSAADFCARALPRTRLRALRGTAPAFDRSRWQEMAELGWSGLVVPEYCGGLQAPSAALMAVCRQLGAVAAPEPMLETAVAAAALLSDIAPDDVLLPALLSGAQVLVWRSSIDLSNFFRACRCAPARALMRSAARSTICRSVPMSMAG